MPEPDAKDELGGLARSIDALFSRPVPELGDGSPAPESWDAAPALQEPVGDPIADTESIEPDPFESLESSLERRAEDLTEPSLSFTDVAVPEEVAWDVLEPEAALPQGGVEPSAPEQVPEEAPVEGLHAVHEPLPDAVDAPSAPAPDEAVDGGLAEAVEAFLSGAPDAADEIRAISARLQERLALDPLADAVERLVLVGDGSPHDEAVALAQEVAHPAVASRLVQRMGQDHDDQRRADYVVLSQRLGMAMAMAFRGALTDSTDRRVRRAYYDGLIAMGETSRPVIEAMLEDDNRFLVRNAVALLGEMGGEGAVELVTSALANTDARVRCEALGSLAKLGGEDSGQLILASLEDSDAKVRAAAAVAAGDLKIERALKPILALLDGEDDSALLAFLLGGLGRLGDPGAVQAIEKRAVTSLFSKPPTEVRVAAYRALHEIGTPHARELIRQASDDKDPVVRTTVRGLASAE